MEIEAKWQDYKLLDMCDGQKLEKWGDIILIRPDPQIIWKEKTFENKWNKADAIYNRSKTGGGYWKIINKIPKKWQIHYKDLTFNIKPMGFKHTGIFPEQAANWDWMMKKIHEENLKRNIDEKQVLKNSENSNFGKEKIEVKNQVKILNLFAYTGAATIACLKAGASVTHVDSSRGMCDWAKENVESSNLKNANVRFLIDDVKKFVNREIRRENKYDGIIMDPPSYGRGKNGEVWKFETDLEDLIDLCMNILSPNAIFFLVNSYTTGISSKVTEDILRMKFEKYKIKKGKFESGELGLKMEDSNLYLPCGNYGRWEI